MFNFLDRFLDLRHAAIMMSWPKTGGITQGFFQNSEEIWAPDRQHIWVFYCLLSEETEDTACPLWSLLIL